MPSVFSSFNITNFFFLSMLTDIVTKSFHNLKLQRDMNILQENYSSGFKPEDVERFSNLPKYIPFFYPLSLTCQKSFHPVLVRKRCNSAIMKCSYEIELLRLTFLFKML